MSVELAGKLTDLTWTRQVVIARDESLRGKACEMTAEIVKLGKVRKAKARADKARQAAENRVVHGRTKAERKRMAAEKDRVRRELDGTKRARPASEWPAGEAPDDGK